MAREGDANAQYNLGTLYNHGRGVQKDYAEAASWYRLAAQQGNLNACYALGVLYQLGQGIERDEAEAARLYETAAHAGNAAAQYNLGSLYHHGNGIGQDFEEAAKWTWRCTGLYRSNPMAEAGHLRIATLMSRTVHVDDGATYGNKGAAS